MSIAEKIAHAGWEQGSIISAESLRKLSNSRTFEDSDLGVVLTQSCDLLHDCFKSEPSVELVIASSIEAVEKKYANARHPRIVDFHINGDKLPCRVTAADLMTFPRNSLAEVTPSDKLKIGKADLYVLQEWRVNRFIRVARPDDFNVALNLQEKKLKQWVAKAHQEVAEIRFRFDPPSELGHGQRYQVQFFLLADGSPGDLKKVTILSKLAHDLDSLLEQCGFLPYGELDRVTFGYLDEITVAQYRETLAFEAGDHLTIAATAPVRGRAAAAE